MRNDLFVGLILVRERDTQGCYPTTYKINHILSLSSFDWNDATFKTMSKRGREFCEGTLCSCCLLSLTSSALPGWLEKSVLAGSRHQSLWEFLLQHIGQRKNAAMGHDRGGKRGGRTEEGQLNLHVED